MNLIERAHSIHSHHEEFLHPNQEIDVASETSNMMPEGTSLRHYDRTKKRGCRYYFGKLDYEILRPLLIYNYEKE